MATNPRRRGLACAFFLAALAACGGTPGEGATPGDPSDRALLAYGSHPMVFVVSLKGFSRRHPVTVKIGGAGRTGDLCEETFPIGQRDQAVMRCQGLARGERYRLSASGRAAGAACNRAWGWVEGVADRRVNRVGGLSIASTRMACPGLP